MLQTQPSEETPEPTWNQVYSLADFNYSPWPMAGHDPCRTSRSPYLGGDQPVVHWRADYSSAAIARAFNEDKPNSDAYFLATEPVLDSEENIILGLSQPYTVSSSDAAYNLASVVSLAPDGTEYWRVNLGEGTVGTPAISPQGAICVPVGGRIGGQHLWGFSSEGYLRWKKPTECRWPCPVALVPERAFIFESRDACTVLSLTNRDQMLINCGAFKLGARPDSLAFDNAKGPYRLPRFTWGPTIRRIQFAINPLGFIHLLGSDNRLYSVTPLNDLAWVSADDVYIYSGTSCTERGQVFAAGWQTGDASGRGRLFAWDSSGKIKFAVPLPQVPEDKCLAIGADGRVFIGARGCPLLSAIAPDGREVWRRDVADDLLTGLTVDAGGNLYFGSRRGFWSLTADGADRWFWPAEDEVKLTPIIGRHGTIYAGLSQALVALGNKPEYPAKYKRRNPR